MFNHTKPSPSINRKDSGVFSPIYVNNDVLESTTLSALYEFSTVFFPNLGSGILRLLLDMEKKSRSVIAAVTPQERARLTEELERITVEMKYTVKDKGKEMIMIPISISPSEVLKNATLGKKSLYNKKREEEINDILISFIKREMRRRAKLKIEAFLKTLLLKPRIPPMLKELLSRGFIDKEGRLAEGTTIKDLTVGKYARLFKKVVPDELIGEALLIEETVKAYYGWKNENYQTLVNEALREKGILEISLGEMTKRE